MLYLEDKLVRKREEAPAHLVLAVDLVRECIKSASRKVSNQSLTRTIEKLFDDNKRYLSHTVRFRVRDDAVDVFDGAKSDRNHAHVAIDQANGNEFYWRNRRESHGSRNFLR